MEKDNNEDVRKYYNEHVDDEDHRLDEHPFEVPVTMHFVNKYLNPGSYIFDVACGTGRFAKLLLDKGFFMGLNDLSDKNIELVKQRLNSNRNILFIERSDARESAQWASRKWEAIFIMGPLYHMINRDGRLKILEMANHNLKPGGFVFSSFMTRLGALVYGLKHNPKGILYSDGARKLWQTGTDNRFVEDTEYFTNAWFSHPHQVNPLIEQAGFIPLHLAGAEGIFGERFELYHQLDEELKRKWMEFVIENCEDPYMINQSKHLLSVAQKPF